VVQKDFVEKLARPRRSVSSVHRAYRIGLITVQTGQLIVLCSESEGILS
jgi:hypothetical protein